MHNKIKIKRFEDLIVWQKSLVLSKRVYQTTSRGAYSRDWGLREQTRRASVSVLSNIAEGFGKYSNREFKKYLAISNGSTFEVKAQIYLARELEYIGDPDAEEIILLCEEISRLIGALRKKMN
jgi:four helix bundle protein